MSVKRFMAVVHLRSPWSRPGIKPTDQPPQEDAARFATRVRSCYPEAEAILSIEHGCIFCLTDSSAKEVWKKLAPGLFRTDNLSILEIGSDVCSSHPGLQQWDWLTRRLLPREPEEQFR
jgi:hypothetical protein